MLLSPLSVLRWKKTAVASFPAESFPQTAFGANAIERQIPKEREREEGKGREQGKKAFGPETHAARIAAKVCSQSLIEKAKYTWEEQMQ